MTYQEAMDPDSDRQPDTRFGLERSPDLSDLVAWALSFKGVLPGALAAGGSVRGINVKGGAKYTDPQERFNKLVEFVKPTGPRSFGLYTRLHDSDPPSYE